MEKIVSSYYGNCAAYVCYKYSTATSSAGEWFLPSKDELNLMYKNVGSKIRAGASDDWHWSSSLDYNDDAWIQSFSDGHQLSTSRDFTYCVRAVRAFSN